ncbi:MAG: hypothetical protein ACD_16C00076G0002 [uncultured bacterium]|nr:MAG: hypothetical protein ACD_16C00076G0002 [uncultured bacterium]HBG34944.1 tol-pal system protein YbgF [Holosporales bacterium]HBW24433.1 tol-pal system protein YbgF [Holosporales bacterium]HCC24407.1 tol-pal system protein YbgF [Holosporales bacterium]HCE95521.1 tol-pal system protein YbgF [Holosporales bacterium]
MRQNAQPFALSKSLLSTTILTLALIFTMSTQTQAQQDNASLVVELIDRVGQLEEQNREFRGRLEEAHHEIEALTKHMESLSNDMDYRMNTAKGEAGSLSDSSTALPLTPSSSSRESAEAPATSSSSDAYEKARDLLEQGNYSAAEKAFTSFVNDYPKDEQAGAAQYWLGVTYYARGDRDKAAAAFAKVYKTYPKSPKAPDSLLKLAKSLAALNRKSDACTALDQLAEEYPKVHKAERVSEQKKLGCIKPIFE